MNLFELFVKIGVDDQASGKLSKLSSSLGKGLATAAKIGTAAVSAAAAGITALTTAAVNNYAEYEQLVGGVDTLFKGSSQKVQEYAANAFRTAGMSANEYMSTVTSFSASLLQSLGGDTDKAAEYANQALTDMSDNANKMGTSMEMIQNAYQGFAKQNYTMLDNLKLGYGGTKEEMARLIEDASKLSDTVDAQDLSFANIVKAINVVQTEMGITGTTAKEAGATIAGSVGAMKSAWANLLTGLADGNANVGELVNNLVTTIVGDGTESNLGVLGNVMPAIKTALSGASKLVSELLPKIVQEIPSIINDNLPILAEAAISIIQSLVDGIGENQEMLMKTAFETIKYLANSLIKMLPQIVQLGLDLIVSLANGIADSLPELIPTIVDVFLQIVNTLTNPETLGMLLGAAIAILTALSESLLNPETINQLLDVAIGVVNGLVTFLMDNLSPLLNAAIDIVMALVDYILDPDNLGKLVETAVEMVVAIAGGLVGAAGELVKAMADLIEKLIEKFGETDWGALGESILDGIKAGIEGAWNNLKEWFSGLFDDLIGIAKKILGIASPSKVFKKLGKWTAEGFGIGWDDEFADVTKDIEDSLNFGGYDYEVVYDGNGIVGSPASGLVGGGVTVIQHIYSEAKTAADLMQEALYQQERAVYLGV